MGRILLGLAIAFMTFIYVGTLYGLMEVLYVAAYVGVFLLVANLLLAAYRMIFKIIRRPITLNGRVVSTTVVLKSSVYGGLGRGSTSTSPIRTRFNCIDLLTTDGQVYKILESYTDDTDYNGKIPNGKEVEITVRKCDSLYFIEEELFMKFFGIRKFASFE